MKEKKYPFILQDEFLAVHRTSDKPVNEVTACGHLKLCAYLGCISGSLYSLKYQIPIQTALISLLFWGEEGGDYDRTHISKK